MNCEFCEKLFSNSQNCIRHTKICKKNISTISNTDILIKDKEIQMLKQQIELLQSLLTKNIPVQKSTNQKFSNEEPDKAIEPKYKTPIEKYINIECKNSMTIREFVDYTRENFTIDDFKSIVMCKYERKYITMIKKMTKMVRWSYKSKII